MKIKKFVFSALCGSIAVFVLATPISYAEPDASPTLTQTPTSTVSASPTASVASTQLIKYQDYGECVVRIQIRLRELGYLCFKPTGNFQSMTVEATKRFQQMQVDENGLAIMADGSVGAQSMKYLFAPGAKRADIAAKIPIGSQLTGTASVVGELIPWGSVKEQLVAGQTYHITDYNTGAEFDMIFAGGENHAEMECKSPSDTAIYKEAFGGEFNYSKRPVVVLIGGKRIAASLQGFPHGEDTVQANEMDGHACMYFDESLSHVGALPDVEHFNQVYKAAGK